MKIVIDLPDHVGKWLTSQAEYEFRTVEEMACVIIRKAHRNETKESIGVLSNAIRENQVSRRSDCACSSFNEAR